ncbi:sensor domain-containing protein [Mycolicibacterium sp. Dal123E01]|uniref:sensor domain-containing protein n=1 Tax=Mycolicibacterium sp. Dal123E01 TaxID=3457578 RepID=UPI00403ECE3F
MLTTDALPKLRVDVPQMRDLVASPALEAGAIDTSLWDLDANSHYTPPECLSTMLWGVTTSYAGLDARGAYGQTYKDPGTAGGHAVAQMVVMFADPGAVTTLVRRPDDSQRWACSRFMAAKSNAVIDGLLCSYDLAERTVQIAKAILAKIAD